MLFCCRDAGEEIDLILHIEAGISFPLRDFAAGTSAAMAEASAETAAKTTFGHFSGGAGGHLSVKALGRLPVTEALRGHPAFRHGGHFALRPGGHFAFGPAGTEAAGRIGAHAAGAVAHHVGAGIHHFRTGDGNLIAVPHPECRTGNHNTLEAPGIILQNRIGGRIEGENLSAGFCCDLERTVLTVIELKVHGYLAGVASMAAPRATTVPPWI